MEELAEAEEKMTKSFEAFQQEILNIRTGRASVHLLDSIEVDVYGSNMRCRRGDTDRGMATESGGLCGPPP